MTLAAVADVEEQPDPLPGPITNGDTWAHEPRDGDKPAVAALKAEWREIAAREQRELEAYEAAARVARQWDGRAREASRRMRQAKEDRARVEAAEAALLGRT